MCIHVYTGNTLHIKSGQTSQGQFLIFAEKKTVLD